MAKPIITIIGLGTTGASLGLGLQREEGNFEIVGHDKDPGAAQQARKQGAVHRTEWNLHRACDGADMIVLAIPLGELDEILPLIAEDLRPEMLVLAVTNVMQPAIALATKYLPESVHFVVGHPILSGIGGMLTIRRDLFEEVIFAITTGLQTKPDAVQLASDFIERMGAKPLYVDAHEHDGLIAGVEQLPQLLAASLLRISSASPAWREAKKLAGRQFAQSTEMGSSAEQLFGALQTNRDNLLHRIDQLRTDLAELRELLVTEPLEEEEEHPLLTALKAASDVRDRWEMQAILKKWDEEDAPTSGARQVESSGMLRQMFFGNLMNRRGANQDK